MSGSGDGYVYMLAEPHDATIRYIGQSQRPFRDVLSRHRTQYNSSCFAWFTELNRRGLEPLAIILEDGLSEKDRLEKESHLITLGFFVKWPLLNQANWNRCACSTCMYCRRKQINDAWWKPELLCFQRVHRYGTWDCPRLIDRILELEELLDIALTMMAERRDE